MFESQFEVLTRLAELWQSRIDGCPDAPVLEYAGANPDGTHAFHLLSGMVDAPAEKTRSFYDYLLVEDVDSYADAASRESSSIPVEALFNDLSLCGQVFPLTRYTRGKWDSQHAVVRQLLLIADVRDIAVEGSTTAVSICTWGSGMTLELGRQYRLSPRYIDFNLTKVLSTLLELDLRCDGGRLAGEAPETPAFLSLISNPRAFATGDDEWMRAAAKAVDIESTIQSTFRQLHQLGSEAAGALLLKPSQRKAARRILSHPLAVVWGPPGLLVFVVFGRECSWTLQGLERRILSPPHSSASSRSTRVRIPANRSPSFSPLSHMPPSPHAFPSSRSLSHLTEHSRDCRSIG
jgi:hypothetical protein